MGLEVTEGQDIVTLAEQTGQILMVEHILQYHPGIQKLEAIIDSGELGRSVLNVKPTTHKLPQEKMVC